MLIEKGFIEEIPIKSDGPHSFLTLYSPVVREDKAMSKVNPSAMRRFRQGEAQAWTKCWSLDPSCYQKLWTSCLDSGTPAFPGWYWASVLADWTSTLRLGLVDKRRDRVRSKWLLIDGKECRLNIWWSRFMFHAVDKKLVEMYNAI